MLLVYQIVTEYSGKGNVFKKSKGIRMGYVYFLSKGRLGNNPILFLLVVNKFM